MDYNPREIENELSSRPQTRSLLADLLEEFSTDVQSVDFMILMEVLGIAIGKV